MKYISVKKIISNYEEDQEWFGFNYKMNIYRGCCHGCIYCDSRSNCYQVVDFDTVKAKENSLEIIESDLKSKRKKGVIDTGSMSDPYNPFEKKYCLTRNALEEINKMGFGVSIATKSSLVTRDIDILKKIKKHSPVLVKITITTFDDELCKKIEPNVCSSTERFKALKELNDNDIYSGILLTPILPFINDTEENIISIVRKASECKVKFIFAFNMGVTLRQNQREYYYEQLRKNFKDNEIVNKYIKTYGDRYMCNSLNSKNLWKVFVEECEKYGILYKMEDIIRDYKSKYEVSQISWF